MSLHFGLYESASGNMWRDLSAIAHGLKFSANRHGFLSLSCEAPMSLIEAFQVFDRPGLPHVEVNWSGFVAWAGRLEDPAVIAGGVRIGALGYQRALYDAPYTALWSETRVSEAFSPDVSHHSAYGQKERFEADNNNRLFVALVKNNAYSLNQSCGWMLSAPDQGRKQIVTISLDYEFKASANCTFRVVSFDWSAETFVNGAVENSIVGDGTTKTGSLSITLAGAQDVAGIDLIASTAHTYAGETAAEYLKVTNVRVKTTTESTVRAGLIASDILTYLNGLNPGQISTSVALIENTALDLTDELYLDEWPGDILERLVGLGDSQTPPRRWEWAVWEGQLLALRPRASQALEWFVDVSAPEMERTLDLLRNSAYAVYQTAGGRTKRTAVSADTFSASRYAITRREAVAVNTTSATQAATHRDTFINDRKDPPPRAGLEFTDLFDQFGNRWPPWALRPGHIVTARNLPATLGPSVDRIRSFVVDETEVDVDRNRVKAVPETPLTSLETVVVDNSFSSYERNPSVQRNGR